MPAPQNGNRQKKAQALEEESMPAQKCPRRSGLGELPVGTGHKKPRLARGPTGVLFCFPGRPRLIETFRNLSGRFYRIPFKPVYRAWAMVLIGMTKTHGQRRTFARFALSQMSCKWFFMDFIGCLFSPLSTLDYRGGALYSEPVAMQAKIFRGRASRRDYARCILQLYDLQ